MRWKMTASARCIPAGQDATNHHPSMRAVENKKEPRERCGPIPQHWFISLGQCGWQQLREAHAKQPRVNANDAGFGGHRPTCRVLQQVRHASKSSRCGWLRDYLRELSAQLDAVLFKLLVILLENVVVNQLVSRRTVGQPVLEVIFHLIPPFGCA